MSVSIAPFGVRYPDGAPLAAAIGLTELAGRAVAGSARELEDQAERLREVLQHPPTFGLDLTPARPIDMTNPAEAGWTVVVASRDPRSERLLELIAPLARHRGMQTAALEFDGAGETDYAEWVGDHYLATEASSRPRYVLLLGGPEVLPFSLQVELAASFAIVGRLDFDTDDELAAYVEKLMRIERAPEAVARPEAVVLGVDWGSTDVTWFSRRFMAAPIADQIEGRPPFAVCRLFGDAATKDALRETLVRDRPALVYTVSHGLFADPAHGGAVQRRLNGSICCARTSGAQTTDWAFGADDVPADDVPFCHGGLFVEFACWGYGTPTESSFDHWSIGEPTTPIHADRPFVAALPKRLLAHPQGPVAFIGHVDTAWLHGFTDPHDPFPQLGALYDARLEPFRTIVDRSLLRLWPAGYALEDLHARTAWLSTRLATFLSSTRSRGLDIAGLSEGQLADLAENFIRRNDSMFFLLLGDPAARVRVGT